MAATNINRVVLTGNLTADPELRSLPSGTSVCELRSPATPAARTTRTGEWEDKPNYFNVKVWGAQGENAARFLSKGRPVAIDGRLEWREWEAQDGAKRQAIDIIADSVQFLGSRDDTSGGGGVRAATGAPGAATSRSTSGISSPHRSAPAAATTTFRSRSSQPARPSICSRQPRSNSTPTQRGKQWQRHGRGKPARRREKRSGPGGGRRKPCQHCRDKIEQVDYKDVASLRKFISEKGKIRSRRITGACRRHQGQIARAVKRARELALLPYVNEGGRDDSPAPRARRPRPRTVVGQMPEAILLKDVETLGEQGKVVDVSKGYLRNYLIPRKLAQPATRGAVEAVRRRQEAAERAEREYVERAQENAALLNKTVLTIPQQAGADGRLFGSVTAQDVADAIREARGLRLEKQSVHLPEPIKNVGTYMVVVDVVDGVTATVKTMVVAKEVARRASGPACAPVGRPTSIHAPSPEANIVVRPAVPANISS